MSITVGTTQAGTDTTAETSAPSGSGGLLILYVRVETGGTITTPSGWTSRANVSDAFSSTRQVVFTRASDGGADDTPTVTLAGGTSNWQTAIVRDTGLDSSPIDTSATGSNTFSSTINVPTVTTAVDNERIYAAVTSGAADRSSGPSGYTVLVEYETGGDTLFVCYKDAGTAGSYGGETVTMSFANSQTATTLALKTAGGVAPIITSNGGGATATIVANEGQTAATTVVASGTPTPTYSITGGVDSGDFSINSTSGSLTFTVTPDYDNPADADLKSDYIVEVTATNTAGTDVQTLTVVVHPMRSGSAPAAPLDDAKYFYKFLADHLAGNTQYPNYGTRDEPLILGDDYTADAQDPDWATDATGGHLVYTNAGDSYVHAVAPQAMIDAASFTVAVRITWTDQSTIGSLFNAIKDIDNDIKTIFLHRQSNNTYEGRVFDGVVPAQVSVISTTIGTNGTTHTIVFTYEVTTKTLTLYVQGTSEATSVADHDRLLRGSDYYLEWPVGVGLADPTLSPNCKYRRMAFWDRCLSSGEVLALQTNIQWTTDSESQSTPELYGSSGGLRGYRGMCQLLAQ